MAIIICEQCGNTKRVTPSEAERRRFCSWECKREFEKKRKEFCPDCGVKLTLENAYNRSSDPENVWLDNYCKSCRIRHNEEAYQRRREKAGVAPKERRSTGDRKERICGYDDSERGTRRTWIKRMLADPIIFADTFHRPATLENIKQAAAQIGV